MRELKKLVENIESFLPSEYFKSLDHGQKHSHDLLVLSKYLLESEGLTIDLEVLYTSIMLHDVFAHVGKKHGDLAVKFFLEHIQHLFTPMQQEKIKEAILYHDEKNAAFVVLRKSQALESQILYDVDNMDAFGVKGVYRYIKVYASRGVEIFRLAELVAENILSRYETLCFASSKEISKENFTFAHKFFENAKESSSIEGQITEFLYRNHSDEIHEIFKKAKNMFKDLKSNTETHFSNQFFDTLYQCYE